MAERPGVSWTLVLEWVNHADFCRVRRNAANLAAALERAKEKRRLVRCAPSESEVARWVEQAKTLPRVVEH